MIFAFGEPLPSILLVPERKHSTNYLALGKYLNSVGAQFLKPLITGTNVKYRKKNIKLYGLKQSRTSGLPR
jgi:hypothetical protein